MKKYLITGLLLAAVVLVPVASQASTVSQLTARLNSLMSQLQVLLASQSGSQLAAVVTTNQIKAATDALSTRYNTKKSEKMFGAVPLIMIEFTRPGSPNTLLSTAQTNEDLILTWKADGPANVAGNPSSVTCRRKFTSSDADTSNVRLSTGGGTYNGAGETGYSDVTIFKGSTQDGWSTIKIIAPGTYTFNLICAEGTADEYSNNATITVTGVTPPAPAVSFTYSGTASWQAGSPKTLTVNYANFSGDTKSLWVGVCNPANLSVCSPFNPSGAIAGLNLTGGGTVNITRTTGLNSYSRVAAGDTAVTPYYNNYQGRLKVCPSTQAGVAGTSCAYKDFTLMPANAVTISNTDGSNWISAQQGPWTVGQSKKVNWTPTAFSTAVDVLLCTNKNLAQCSVLKTNQANTGYVNVTLTSSVLPSSFVTGSNYNVYVRAASDNSYTQNAFNYWAFPITVTTAFTGVWSTPTPCAQINPPLGCNVTVSYMSSCSVAGTCNPATKPANLTCTGSCAGSFSIPETSRVFNFIYFPGRTYSWNDLMYNLTLTSTGPWADGRIEICTPPTNSKPAGGILTEGLWPLSNHPSLNYVNEELSIGPSLAGETPVGSYTYKVQFVDTHAYHPYLSTASCTTGSSVLASQDVTVNFTSPVNQGAISLTSVNPMSVIAGQTYTVNYRLTNTGNYDWGVGEMKATITTPGMSAISNANASVVTYITPGNYIEGQFTFLAPTSAGTRTHQLYLYRKSGTTWTPISNAINITVNITASYTGTWTLNTACMQGPGAGWVATCGTAGSQYYVCSTGGVGNCDPNTPHNSIACTGACTPTTVSLTPAGNWVRDQSKVISWNPGSFPNNSKVNVYFCKQGTTGVNTTDCPVSAVTGFDINGSLSSGIPSSLTNGSYYIKVVRRNPTTFNPDFNFSGNSSSAVFSVTPAVIDAAPYIDSWYMLVPGKSFNVYWNKAAFGSNDKVNVVLCNANKYCDISIASQINNTGSANVTLPLTTSLAGTLPRNGNYIKVAPAGLAYYTAAVDVALPEPTIDELRVGGYFAPSDWTSGTTRNINLKATNIPNFTPNKLKYKYGFYADGMWNGPQLSTNVDGAISTGFQYVPGAYAVANKQYQFLVRLVDNDGNDYKPNGVRIEKITQAFTYNPTMPGVWTQGACSATACGTSGTYNYSCQPSNCSGSAPVVPCSAPACTSAWTLGVCSATTCGTTGTQSYYCPTGKTCPGSAPAPVSCSAAVCPPPLESTIGFSVNGVGHGGTVTINVDDPYYFSVTNTGGASCHVRVGGYDGASDNYHDAYTRVWTHLGDFSVSWNNDPVGSRQYRSKDNNTTDPVTGNTFLKNQRKDYTAAYLYCDGYPFYKKVIMKVKPLVKSFSLSHDTTNLNQDQRIKYEWNTRSGITDGVTDNSLTCEIQKDIRYYTRYMGVACGNVGAWSNISSDGQLLQNEVNDGSKTDPSVCRPNSSYCDAQRCNMKAQIRCKSVSTGVWSDWKSTDWDQVY